MSLLAGCLAPPPAPRCALAPAGFHAWRTLRSLGEVPIVPPEPLVIWVGGDGDIRWNGVSLGGTIDLSPAQILDQYVAMAAQIVPIPYVAIDFARGTPCARVEQARGIVARHMNCVRSLRCVQGGSGSLDASGGAT